MDQALETVSANQEILDEFIKIAETRYGVDKGLQQDVIRAQVARSKLVDKEIKLRQKRTSLVARINALANEPADTPLGKPVIPDAGNWLGRLDALVQQADTANPMLAAWKATIDQSQKHVDLLLRKRYPDFTVGMAYTQRDRLDNGMKGHDFLSAMFSIRLPLYQKRKQDQAVQENRIKLNAVEHRYRSVQNNDYV